MNRSSSLLTTLVCVFGIVLGASGSVQGNGIESLDFDIFRSNDSLTVWIDLDPILTQQRVDQMNQGIDLAIRYDLTLLRPRRIWGAQKLNNASRFLRLGYRVLSEDFFLSFSPSLSDSDRYFVSLEALREYLTDSIQTSVANLDSLDRTTRYYLELDITAISLTAFNLASEEDSREGQESSPIKYLFRKFLEVTDFGREEFHFKSRIFSLAEIAGK